MKIILQHRFPLYTSSENGTIAKVNNNNNNKLEVVVVNDSCKYFLYKKEQLKRFKQHQEIILSQKLLYCDNLEDKSIIKLLKYNNQQIKQNVNKIIYNMDNATLSELKKCILKTNCNIIEITDCDTRYDRSSKYGYFVELCETLDKFKTLIYII